jgi:RNA processing factor Prp31
MDIQENNNSEPEETHTSESESYLQKEFNYGQARINFELNEVDKRVIEALQVVVQILKQVKALPALRHDVQELDFSNIEKAISEACQRSATVADIRPPGCEGPYPN